VSRAKCQVEGAGADDPPTARRPPGTTSDEHWIPLGGGRELKLACDDGGWRWTDWRIRRNLPPVVEIATLPPPGADDAARRFASRREAVAFFAARGGKRIPSSSREARAESPLGKAARGFETA
jgi:hypothetical protein